MIRDDLNMELLVKTHDDCTIRTKAHMQCDYCYVDMKNPKRRFSKQSQSKKRSQCPAHLTELQWANERSLSRIWDCGKTRWECEVS